MKKITKKKSWPTHLSILIELNFVVLLLEKICFIFSKSWSSLL